VDEDAYLAFDSVTGQLCKSFRAKSLPVTTNLIPSSHHSEREDKDPILNAIRADNPESRAEETARMDFIRGLPTCADIH
jgi:hypothetical protein